jgi:hypothetical protein
VVAYRVQEFPKLERMMSGAVVKFQSPHSVAVGPFYNCIAHGIEHGVTASVRVEADLEGGVIPVIPNSCGISAIGEKIGTEGHAREFW